MGPVFVVQCRVRQGGILSLLLFAIYIDGFLHELRESGYDVHTGRLSVGATACIDDITVFYHALVTAYRRC